MRGARAPGSASVHTQNLGLSQPQCVHEESAEMASQTQGLKSTPLPRCFKADELLFPASPSLNTESFSVAEGSA